MTRDPLLSRVDMPKSRRSDRRRMGRERSGQHSPARTPGANFVRTIPAYEILSDDRLSEIEEHADWILCEVGIRFQDDPDALRIFADAGATVDGDRVRFDRGHVKELCATAPAVFTMHARNPIRNVTMGANHVVLAPCDCAPFVTDLDNGRRYGTLADHHNLTRLLQSAPGLHHNPAIICEPSDIPVNKRHLDMLYSQFCYSDKPVMGLVNNEQRAEDSLSMARIVFGSEFLDQHPVLLAGTAVQSPLTFNAETTDTIRRYALAGQANMVTPFIVMGAMSPTTIAGTLAQAHAEAMTGIAFTQLVRPGSPVVYSVFATTMDLRSGAATYGTPESSLANMAIAQMGRRMKLPVRCGGQLTSSKIADAQALQESTSTLESAALAGANYILQAAGWLEGGLTIGYEKFVIDAERCSALGRILQGIEFDQNEMAKDAFIDIDENTSNLLGSRHTMANYATANFNAELVNSESFEQWTENGALDTETRARVTWKRLLSEHEDPELDAGTEEELRAFIEARKSSYDDSWY